MRGYRKGRRAGIPTASTGSERRSHSDTKAKGSVDRGIVGINQADKKEAGRLLDGGDPALVSARPSEALMIAAGSMARPGLAEDAILFMANIQLYWDKEQGREAAAMIVHGIWNLRDQLKAKGATLVMLTTIGATVPAELQQDVLVLDEPLPTAQELNKIVDGIFTEAKVSSQTS